MMNTGNEQPNGVLWQEVQPQRSFGTGNPVPPSVATPFAPTPVSPGMLADTEPVVNSHRWAFLGMCLFLIMTTLRPQDIYPSVFGSLSFTKYIAIATFVLYLGSKLVSGERPFSLPLEMMMMLLIALLGVAFIPFAAAPGESIQVLTEMYLKVILIVAMLIGLVNTRQRLRTVFNIVVACGTIVALFSIHAYFDGQFINGRLAWLPNSLFGNSNDLALIFDLLLPFTIILGITAQGLRRALYFGCTAVLSLGVFLTFSRGGFLGMMAVGAILLWKLARNNKKAPVIALALMLGVLVVAVPNGYGTRLLTIINLDQDETGSAQERQELLKRAIVVAATRPVIGVGMGNYHIYSLKEKRAHNSYIEIAAELGLAGLLAFLVLIFAPLRSMLRLERETRASTAQPHRPLKPEQEIYYFSLGLQAVLVAYFVCSMFGSTQYYWFLYLPVAYCVALRQIYAALRERSLVTAAVPSVASAQPFEPARPALAESPTGALWQTR